MKTVTDVAAFFWNNKNLTSFTLKAYSSRPYESMILPTLPSNLESIEIFFAPHLSFLPALPASVKIVSVHEAGVKELNLPAGLSRLAFGSLPQLRKLKALPTRLESLAISNMPNLAELLPPLPDSLEELSMVSFATWMPAIPDALKSLSITRSEITELPPLPSALEELYIQECPNLRVPELPASLKRLTIDRATARFTLGETKIQFVAARQTR